MLDMVILIYTLLRYTQHAFGAMSPVPRDENPGANHGSPVFGW